MLSHVINMYRRRFVGMSLVFWLLQFSLCPVMASHYRSSCHQGYHKFPKCVDTPGAYRCECGPGFEWNSQMCVAKAADSRLEFLDVSPVGYTLLLGKTFPKLSAFTISMWVKTGNIERDRVYLSYCYNDQTPQIMVEGSGKTTKVYVANQVETVPTGLTKNKWQHMAFTWTNKGGEFAAYFDGQQIFRNDKLAVNVTLPVAGDFVLGQAPWSRETRKFDAERMFIGDLSHVNIWSHAMNKSDIQKISEDCSFMQCGNAVQWVDFRSGTRGSMKLRWPSGVFGTSCSRESGDVQACDLYCSHTIGPQCNQEYAGNIKWPRTPAGKTQSLPCPGKGDYATDSSPVPLANRSCVETGGTHGMWEEPIMIECASKEQLNLQKQIQEAIGRPSKSKSFLLQLSKKLDNFTRTVFSKNNPTDLSIHIGCVQLLVDAQSQSLQQIGWSEEMLQFSQTHFVYPTFEETKEFTRIMSDVINIIMDTKHDAAWSATRPRGNQASDFIKVIQQFTDVIATSLVLHRRRREISLQEASISALTNNFQLVLTTVKMGDFKGMTFPPISEDLPVHTNYLSLPQELFDEVDLAHNSSFVVISTVKYQNVGRLLPNHPEPITVKYFRDKVLEHAHKEDNVNTPILVTRIHMPDSEEIFSNITTPIIIDLNYHKPFNVSNPECVSLHLSNNSNDWQWGTKGCQVISHTYQGARCLCRHPGIYALTTDMYDDNWNCCNERVFEVTIPAYVGYIVNVSFCIASLILFSHFKCVSDTVNVHRNLAMSIVLAETAYILGVARREHEGVCKGCAIVLHYFFTSEFCWLCNEAFNLYVEVANSIHAETQQQRPMLRYYIIGWVFPGALVGALLGANWEGYFADDICWINMDQIWLFVGPVAGVWAITCFVLTFTGKDIVESSYSKDKQANKVVSNHCKGCWVQITLIMISWAFAFVSVKMVGIILQVLYAFFVILQGSFFFVFFCVLNGEVATALRERRARLGLAVSSPSFSTKYSVYKRTPTSPSSKRNRDPPAAVEAGHASGSLASGSGGSGSVSGGGGGSGGGINNSTNHFEMRNRSAAARSDLASVEFSEELVTSV
ncbi:adhesion G protein-coupled receptor L2-like [Glandiceps talaboti]